MNINAYFHLHPSIVYTFGMAKGMLKLKREGGLGFSRFRCAKVSDQKFCVSIPNDNVNFVNGRQSPNHRSKINKQNKEVVYQSKSLLPGILDTNCLAI